MISITFPLHYKVPDEQLREEYGFGLSQLEWYLDEGYVVASQAAWSISTGTVFGTFMLYKRDPSKVRSASDAELYWINTEPYVAAVSDKLKDAISKKAQDIAVQSAKVLSDQDLIGTDRVTFIKVASQMAENIMIGRVIEDGSSGKVE